MAEKTTLARPYAKAVFEFASEAKPAEKSKTLEHWSKLLSLLADIAKDDRVVKLLKDRSVPSNDIVDFFMAVSAKVSDEHAKNFMVVLAEHGRLLLLPEIKNLYEALRADAEKTAKVELVTACALNKEEELQFKALLERTLSRTVTLNCAVDKSLLGGYIATAGNYVVDGSVRSLLTNLKETMGDSI